MSETVMYINGLCRCCHARGSCRSLGVPYILGDGQEIYAVMIRETFDIIISPDSGESSASTYTICESCIISLRDAARFKQQVLSCEEKFHKLLLEEDIKLQIGTTDDGEADLYASDDGGVLKPIEIIDDYYVGAGGRATKEEADSKSLQLKDDVDGEADGYSCSEDADFSALESKVEIDYHQEASPKPKETAILRKRKIRTTSTPQDNSDTDCVTSQQKRSKECTTESPNTERNERPCKVCKKQIAYRGLANHMKIHRKDYVKGRLFTCYMCHFQSALYNVYLQHYELEHFDGEGYPCSACGASFRSAKSLKDHYTEHYENETVECGKCGKYVKRKCLVKHSKIHTRTFICDICNQYCPTKQSLMLHTSRHEGSLLNVCDVCGQAFSSNLDLEDHKLEQHVNKSDAVSPKQKNPEDETDGYAYDDDADLELQHETDDDQKSDLCPDTPSIEKEPTVTKSLRKRNMTTTGKSRVDSDADCVSSRQTRSKGLTTELPITESNKLPCSICNKKIACNDLGQHMKIHKKDHVKKRLYTCRICEYQSAVHDDYLQHYELEHFDGDGYPCSACDSSFSSAKSLREHYNEHYENEIVKCGKCNKDVKRKCLRQHSKLHEGRFICDICNHYYSTKQSLTLHISKHKGMFLNLCDACGRSFSSNRELEDHKLTKHVKESDANSAARKEQKTRKGRAAEHRKIELNEVPCNVCNKNIRYRGLKLHMKIHENDHPVGRVYTCRTCNYESANYKEYLEHYEHKHFDGVGYSCSACGASFSSAKMLKDHSIEHYNNETVKCDVCHKHIKRVSMGGHQKTHTERVICDICNRSFNNKHYLILHMFTHGGVKPYLCDLCGQSYALQRDLKAHSFRRHRIGGKRYSCSFCQRLFFDKASMKRHEAIHTGHKPFVCEICNKGYSDKYTLKVHMGVHIEGKPFSCQHCGLDFKYKSTLKKHENKHTGVKSFQCEVCNKAFFQNFYLKTHMRSHTGEKPYECKICNQKFQYKKGKDKHIIKKHSGKHK